MMRSLLLALGLLLPALASAAPQISLLTFAPGEIYWQRFGHNALLVRAPGAEPLVYNYGIFDFQQDNFFLNFARGRMLYKLDAAPLDWTLRQYAAEGRWVVEQQLALDGAQAQALADFLAWNALPENADYRYDYFLANCSTKARDAIDRALDGGLRTQLEARPDSGSFRGEVLRLMAPMPALKYAMDLGLGPRVDAPIDQWQEGFIPMRLMNALRAVRVESDSASRPLVAAERVLIAAAAPEQALPAGSRPMFLFAGIAWAALLLGLHRLRARRAAAVALVLFAAAQVSLAGLAGLVLLLGWLATDHWGMALNHNLLLLHPLWWLLLPAALLGLRRQPPLRGRFTRATTWLCLLAAVAALPLALLGTQPNLHWVLLLLPAHAALLLVLRR
jgi:hypothetical protein